MWGVNPEARGWNVGAVCSDFNLGECISRRSPKCTLIWPFCNRAKKKVHSGLFLHKCSVKLKFEHTASTFQPLASGLTPHMPMFGQKFCENFFIPFLIYERQPNQVQPKCFGDSILFHHYLLSIQGKKVGYTDF